MIYDVFGPSTVRHAFTFRSLIGSFALAWLCVFGNVSAHAQATGNTIGVTYLGPESSMGSDLLIPSLEGREEVEDEWSRIAAIGSWMAG